jgi:hypothetical protein
VIQPAPISCPRCGYDLTGVRTPESPQSTHGTCSECGLEFSWKELESGRMHLPPFSFEHHTGLTSLAFLWTAVRSATGWWLWDKLRMEHEIRAGRLLAFAALFVLMVHLAAIATMIAAAWAPGIYLNGWRPQSWVFPVPPTASSTPMPIPPPAPPPPGAIVLWHDQGKPVLLDDIRPLIVWPYDYSVSTASGRRIVSFDYDVLIGCSAPMLGTPLVFLLLRQTRRRFKLRKLHLLRALCLSGPVVLVTTLLAPTIANAASGMAIWPWSRPNQVMAIVAGTACFAYQTFWWWTFARRYLKAPHALGIAVCGVIIGGLLFAIFSLVTGSLLYNLMMFA